MDFGKTFVLGFFLGGVSKFDLTAWEKAATVTGGDRFVKIKGIQGNIVIN